MIPLIVLVATTGLARVTGWLAAIEWLDSWPHAARLGLAAMFALTAMAHFRQPLRSGMIAMVPPQIPGSPARWVTVTGILEAAGAVGLLIPATASFAAVCLAALLVVMFPANVRAARAGAGVKTMPLPLRGLVQVVFIGACVLAAF